MQEFGPFKVGDRIVCVDNSDRKGINVPSRTIQNGKVYTIKEFLVGNTYSENGERADGDMVISVKEFPIYVWWLSSFVKEEKTPEYTASEDRMKTWLSQ